MVIAAIVILSPVYSQDSFESTIRKFNIGVGMHTDIWFGLPDGVDARTINQGAQVNGMYNYRLGEGVAYIAGGIGISRI